MFLRMLFSFVPFQQHSQDWTSYLCVWKLLVFIPEQPRLPNIDNCIQYSINGVYCCWKKVIPLLAVKKVWLVNRGLGAVLCLQIQQGFDKKAAELDLVHAGAQSRTTLSKCRLWLLEPLPWVRPCREELLCKVTQVPDFPAMLIKGEIPRIIWDKKSMLPKLWYNFKCEMSLRKTLCTGRVVESEMATKACHTGHSCFPLKIACTQKSAFLPSITTHLAHFCRFSALRRFYSAVISHLGFSLINFLWKRST